MTAQPPRGHVNKETIIDHSCLSTVKDASKDLSVSKQELVYVVPIGISIVLAVIITAVIYNGIVRIHQPTYMEQAEHMMQGVVHTLIPQRVTWTEKALECVAAYNPFYHQKTALEKTGQLAQQSLHRAHEDAKLATAYVEKNAAEAVAYGEKVAAYAASEAYVKAKAFAQYAYKEGGEAAELTATTIENAAAHSLEHVVESIHELQDAIRIDAALTRNYLATKIDEGSDNGQSTISDVSKTIVYRTNEPANMVVESVRYEVITEPVRLNDSLI